LKFEKNCDLNSVENTSYFTGFLAKKLATGTLNLDTGTDPDLETPGRLNQYQHKINADLKF
jgi:hypothetical protein